MANAGDSYCVTLAEPHIDWGTFRHTNSRPAIQDECYIPIPSREARRLGLYNSLYGRRDVLGENLFRYRTSDGYMSGYLRAQGNSERGNEYAKQFSDSRGLKYLKTWFDFIAADVGTVIEVYWESPEDIVLSSL